MQGSDSDESDVKQPNWSHGSPPHPLFDGHYAKQLSVDGQHAEQLLDDAEQSVN